VHPINADDWLTPEMARAQNDLEDAAWEATRAVERADDLMDEIDKATPQVIDAEVDEFRRFVLRPDTPDEWRAVRAHIDAGAFTWRDVVEGTVSDNPDVRAAMDALAEMRLPVPSTLPPEAAPAADEPAKPAEEVADEDYFNDARYLD
jgi:hypothetical protein